MMQLAAQVRQRLVVARFRPQRAGDPLTLNRTLAPVKDEKRDELLLPGARRTSQRTAFVNETEAAEQFYAQRGWKSHVPRLQPTDLSRVARAE